MSNDLFAGKKILENQKISSLSSIILTQRLVLRIISVFLLYMYNGSHTVKNNSLACETVGKSKISHDYSQSDFCTAASSFVSIVWYNWSGGGGYK